MQTHIAEVGSPNVIISLKMKLLISFHTKILVPMLHKSHVRN